MKKRIICFLFACTLIFLNLTFFAFAEENKEAFPHAIAYSKAADIGLEKKVDAIEVIEYETGRMIVDTNIDKVYNPEKKDVILMAVCTALNIIKSDSITVAEGAVIDQTNNTLGLKPGMEVAVIDAAAAALLSSDINAVNALALAVDSKIENFIQEMNYNAMIYGMTHTKYTNVTGKLDPNQVTTVSDMTILAFMCYKNQTITDITSSETHYIKTNGIVENKKTLSNPFEMVNSTSEFFNRSVFGLGVSKDSKGITTSLVTYITSKQKFIIVIRSTSERFYNDIIDTLEFVKKNYALIDISKIIFELGANITLDIGGEKVYFTAMKNTVSNVNMVANLFYSKSVSTISDAYTIVPPENLPESVKVGDVISNFRILYNGNQISTISLAVQSIGEAEQEETTLGFTIYQASDVKIQKGSFMQEHSWIIIVGVVLILGAILIIGVNNIKNI